MLNEYKDSGLPEEVYERSIAYGVAVAEHCSFRIMDDFKEPLSIESILF